jgi:hypothetical protein
MGWAKSGQKKWQKEPMASSVMDQSLSQVMCRELLCSARNRSSLLLLRLNALPGDSHYVVASRPRERGMRHGRDNGSQIDPGTE